MLTNGDISVIRLSPAVRFLGLVLFWCVAILIFGVAALVTPAAICFFALFVLFWGVALIIEWQRVVEVVRTIFMSGAKPVDRPPC